MRNILLFTSLTIVFIVLLLADLMSGNYMLSLHELQQLLSGEGDSNLQKIFFIFRLPKSLAAIMAGIALSASGLAMQTLFRNPLAGPYVLGVSSGASLGVALLMLGSNSALLGQIFYKLNDLPLIVAAWLGAGMVSILILILARKIANILTLLIFGVLLGSATTALVSVLQYFSNASALKSYMVWTMGSLSAVSLQQLQFYIPIVLTGSLMLLFMTKSLNALLIGEEFASGVGISVRRVRIFLLLLVSILAGTVTAFSGPIGFIGIAMPHIARLIFKSSNHTILLPASMLLGAIALLFSDIVSQNLIYQQIIPINSVTALLGIPVILYLLITNKQLRDM